MDDVNEKVASMEEKLAAMPNTYFCKEVLSYSAEGRNLDLITISSRDGITDQREELIDGLFPEHNGD